MRVLKKYLFTQIRVYLNFSVTSKASLVRKVFASFNTHT